MPGYDAPQWVFTGLEIEVSGSWFDLNNISNVQIEVVLGLTYQASEGTASSTSSTSSAPRSPFPR